MPLLPIAIIADDLTGAADTAARLVRPRRPVPVSLGAEPRAVEGRSAFAVTTDSRGCSPDVARDRVLAAARSALRQGARLVYKKVDSNLRGNIGAELAALREAGLGPIVLAPAFPARGRTTVNGVALIEGIPVAETEMGRDAEAPVLHSAIRQLLSAQRPTLRTTHIPLAALRADQRALGGALVGCDVVICDAETDADLNLIAEAALALAEPPVLAGSAGLAGAAAARLLGPAVRAEWPEGRSRPVLAVLATSSERLPRQVRAASGAAVPVPLQCASFTWEDELLPELSSAIAQAVAALRAGSDALVYATGPLPDVENPVGLVVEHLAHLAFVVVRQATPAALLVGGGSTAQAVLAALGTSVIEVDDEPLSGLSAGIALGGELDGRPVALKPGAAGGDTAVAELLHYLGRRALALEAKA
ncbi:MAG: four-carbon acid sugar kinase family protein [Armatimonadota bacterium]